MDWTTMSPEHFGLKSPKRAAPCSPLALFDLPAAPAAPEVDAMGTPPMFSDER